MITGGSGTFLVDLSESYFFQDPALYVLSVLSADFQNSVLLFCSVRSRSAPPFMVRSVASCGVSWQSARTCCGIHFHELNTKPCSNSQIIVVKFDAESTKNSICFTGTFRNVAHGFIENLFNIFISVRSRSTRMILYEL